MLVRLFPLQAQDDERSRVEIVRGSTTQEWALPHALFLCSCIQDHLPADASLMGWQSKRELFMMGVQEHKERVVEDWSALFVPFFNCVTR